MVRLLQYLIFGCAHEWEFEEMRPLRDIGGESGSVVYLRCKKCGNWKKKDLI